MEDRVISVVIPVAGSSPALGECLESVLRQDYRRTEVIIVCGADAEGSTALPPGSEDVRVIHQEGHCPNGRLVNDGMRAARGHVKVLLRPECVPLGRGWLRAMAEPFRDEDVGVVVSRFASFDGDEPGLAVRVLESLWPRHRAAGQKREHVSHACDAYRASLLADVGYFEEGMPCPGEAVELSLRVREAGYSIVTAHGALARCGAAGGPGALGALGRALHFGRADARLYREHEVRWLNSGIFSAALFSLLLLPLALVSLPLGLIASGLLFVWGWLLTLRMPVVRWEVPTAVLSFALWVGLVLLVRDGWSPGLFGKGVHPAILRQWLWLAAMIGTFGLLLLRAAGACAWRVLRQPRGWLYALPAGLLALAWWPLAGLGHIQGLVVDSLRRR
ncbi:MAG: glycosyltransferase [Candidatus Brocadiia bacterium]